MTAPADSPPPVCGARAYLPGALVPAALTLERSTDRPAEQGDVERHLRCTLEAHDYGDHHGLVLCLDGVQTGSVWTTWSPGHPPDALLVLPDCDGADGQPCSEYAGHQGGHSPEVYDPLTDMTHTFSH